MAENYDDMLKRRMQTWAKGKEDRLREIENTGDISLWSHIKSIPGDVIREVYLDPLENRSFTGDNDPEPRRDKAYEDAKKAALKNFQLKSQGMPTQSMPINWELLVKKGKI